MEQDRVERRSTAEKYVHVAIALPVLALLAWAARQPALAAPLLFVAPVALAIIAGVSKSGTA